MPRFETMAARTAAATYGMLCLASSQWPHTRRQRRLSLSASLRMSNGCTNGGSTGLGMWYLALTDGRAHGGSVGLSTLCFALIVAACMAEVSALALGALPLSLAALMAAA